MWGDVGGMTAHQWVISRHLPQIGQAEVPQSGRALQMGRATVVWCFWYARHGGTKHGGTKHVAWLHSPTHQPTAQS